MPYLVRLLVTLSLAASTLAAQSPQSEPVWPQRFVLETGQRQGFGFIVGEPGRIVINVQWQGAPLVVSLAKPGRAAIEKQGSGSATIEFDATAEDVRNGVLWAVSLRAVQEQKPTAEAGVRTVRKSAKAAVAAIATGTVSVVHPPANLQRAQAELAALSQNAKSRPARRIVEAAVPVDAVLQTALNGETAARQSALLQALSSRIPSQVQQALTQRIARGAQGRQAAVEQAPVASKQSAMAASKGAMGRVSQAQSAGTGTGGTAAPVGGAQGQSIAAALSVTSLSIAEGRPGDPVMITGRGFGVASPDRGVFFIIGPGTTVRADADHWTDTEILVTVPNTLRNSPISGLPEYPGGQVFVSLGGGKDSNLSRFGFKPSLALVSECTTTDWQLFWFFPGQGDTEYYKGTRLRNGFVLFDLFLWVERVPLIGWMTASSDATIAEFTADTDSPYAKIHWWADAYNAFSYKLCFTYKGPLGLKPH